MSEARKPHSSLWRSAFDHQGHLCNGSCPDIGSEDSRDPECFYCNVLNLEEQYKHLENELDDMTGQFCNEAIHLTRAEDRVRELEEQFEALDDALRDILDVTEKWTKPMNDEERVLHIDTIAKAALAKASSPASRPDVSERETNRERRGQSTADLSAGSSVGVVSARTTESPGESRSETSDPASEPETYGERMRRKVASQPHGTNYPARESNQDRAPVERDPAKRPS